MCAAFGRKIPLLSIPKIVYHLKNRYNDLVVVGAARNPKVIRGNSNRSKAVQIAVIFLFICIGVAQLLFDGRQISE